MKRLFTVLVLSVTLQACSGSVEENKENGKAAASTQSNTQSGLPAELEPKNIAHYEEKLDVAKISQALKNAGFEKGEQKEAEWNRRLAAVTTNEEVQAVVRDQLMYYRQAEQELSAINTVSQQGTQVRQKMLNGFSGMCRILEIMQKLDMTSPEGAVQLNELNPKIKEYGTEIMQGLQLFVQLVKESGQSYNKKAEAKMQGKLKELEGKLE
ncbi:hypothetical protein [Neisseria perflava]|uniref:hypothetical protein n=1 Tax=Neisseria perflava TaxID=33053 RepID=UPI00209F8EF5|nr:hypothetical protein [Neisseria perflava]MCP1659294.1 hypothetical protein [Neisseria perflava]MCP1772802.1 hypothetical protein [Neisseria perflava]